MDEMASPTSVVYSHLVSFLRVIGKTYRTSSFCQDARERKVPVFARSYRSSVDVFCN